MTPRLLEIPDFWTASFCRTVQQAMDAGDAEPAAIVGDEVSVDADVRQALDITVSDVLLEQVEASLAQARLSVAEMFATRLTGAVGASFVRYGPGGRYRRHRDSDPSLAPDTAGRRLTVVAWLNSADRADKPGEFAGGTLRVFNPDSGASIDVVPDAGTLVAFPAQWAHEVMPVTRGTRDVVVDWWL